MPSSNKKKLKNLNVASNLGELNKLADPGLPVDRNANPTLYIKSADKVYLKAQDSDLDGDEEYAYVYYMRYFNIIALIKKSAKYTDQKKYYDSLIGKTKIFKSIERAEALQGSLEKRYEKLKSQKEADKKAQEEAKRKEEEDKKKLEAAKAKRGSGTDSDSGIDSEIDSLLNGNGISSSSDVYQKLKVSHNSILTPKTSENGSGTLISGLEFPSSSTKSMVTDGAPCVSAQDLYDLLKPENESKILILDCRPHATFFQNRIKCNSCISIPAELLDQGVSVGSIERRLPEATRKIWNKRAEKEFIILMDESTKVADITPECRIQRLKDVIFTFDSYSSLKREPLFFDGGFHSWLWHYPSLALKAELPKVQSQPKAVTPVDLSSLDYPELPEEKITPQMPPPPETSSINSSLQYPVLPTGGLENVNGALINPKGSIEQNFQPNATPGPPPGGNIASAASSPGQPGIPSSQSQTGATVPSLPETRSSQIGSPQMGPVNMPSSQPGAPLLKPNIPPMSTAGQQPSTGMAPQRVIPNPAGPRTPSSPPNTTVPHPSGTPVFQPTPNSASPMPPTTQTSPPTVTVPKPSAVPFSSPSSMPPAQPGFSPSEATNSQSIPQNVSVPKVQPASASVSPTSETTEKVSPSSFTQLQGPGRVAASASGQVPHQVAQSIQPGNQPQVPSIGQVPSGGSQIPGQSSLPKAQVHQVTPRDTQNGSQTSVNASKVLPQGAQAGPSGATKQPDSDSVQPFEQKASKPSQQSVPKKPASYVTTPGLPPGWEKVENGGKVYYKDHNTQTTHWKLPTTGTTAAGAQSSSGANGLPAGWERVESDGKVYYKDNNTKTTHWQPPTTGTTAAPQSQNQQKPQQQLQPQPQQQSQPKQQQHQSALKRQSPVDRPTLRRSNSSPNLKKLSDQDTSGPKRPIVDRLSKPDPAQTGPVRPTVNRSAKPLSANQLDSFNPSYGGQGAGLTGLRNLGNTCYMNSVIQCLSSVAPLSAFFLSGAYKDDLNRSSRDGTRGELAENFSALVRVLHSGQFKFVSPGDFKRTVGRFKSQFSGYDQQDSQELLAFLMDGLQEDLNKVKDKPYLKAPPDDLDPQTAATIAWDNHKKRNRSIMVELFDGLFMSTVRCLVCHKESRTFDTFSNLTLPLPSNASRCSLQDCLALFTKPEKMSGDDKWFCPKCQQRRESSKTIQIWRLPAILVVHLKRFQYEGMWRQKLQTSVSFPMSQLDLSSSVVGPKSTTRYDLHAVSNHYGTMHGGHYTAFCKNVYDRKWYKFDDQNVTEMSPRDVVTSAGYLLFYTSFDFQPPKYLIKS